MDALVILRSVLASHEEIFGGDEEAALETVNFLLHDDRELLEDALEVLERFTIRRMVGEKSRRTFHLVQGLGSGFLVLDDFCSCSAFAEKATVTCGDVMCKHMLAVAMARAFRKESTEEIADADVVKYLAPF